MSRIPEPMKYACLKTSGDCPVGKRDADGFCLHTKYCSQKKPVAFEKFIIDQTMEEKEIEYKPTKTQQQTLL